MVSAMVHQLPFFPASLPDETLISRVSRFHILHGNVTNQLTFRELFDRDTSTVDLIVPVNLNVLANRLPGIPIENIKNLIRTNTLFPLFRPFLGRVDCEADLRPDLELGNQTMFDSFLCRVGDGVWRYAASRRSRCSGSRLLKSAAPSRLQILPICRRALRRRL
jgi:hypothetical protein